MTSSRYYIARFAQAFGYQRRNQRMGDAASEMHLLREAEAELGALTWEKVEPIEELSVEYWNLRKFVKENEAIQKNLVTCQLRLDQAHQERATVLNRKPQVHQDLIDERANLLKSLEKLAQKRDDIVAEAREVRRSYDGTKMKLDVISSDAKSSSEEVAKIKAKLLELKERFSSLKQQRLDIGTEIETSDAQIDLIDQRLNDKKKTFRLHASEAFQVIGDGNKEMAILRAESSILETQMRQLYAEIGRFVSRNAQQHPGCAKVVASQRGLVEVMRAIRRSIALNHRLAGTD